MSQLHPSLSLITIFLLILPFPNPSFAREPHIIKFQSPGLYPEGLTYDPISQHFIVASLNKTTFHSISDASIIQTLTLTETLTLIPPNSTTLGLFVDHHNHRLLAAINTPHPHLAAFKLHHSFLTPIFFTALPTADTTNNHLANDVTTSPAGTSYVTNSINNSIWKIDINGSASILSSSKLFNHYPVNRSLWYSHCGLNGVVYVPTKGYLLTVQSNTGKMFKVDVEDGSTREVYLTEELTAADGITVRDDGVVVVISMDSAWFLKSDDSWARGVVIDKIALDRKGFPTSVSVGGGGRVYVVYGYVEEGINGNLNKEREWFRIEEIRSGKESEGETVWPFVLIGLGLLYLVFWRFQMGQVIEKMDKKTA